MKKVQRMLILLIAVLVVAGLLPATAMAEEAAAGKFILVAEAGGKLVIAPEYIPYTQGQTVGAALEGSCHTFTGLEMGQVTAINEVTGNYTRSDQNGGYDLSTPASSVTHYCFSERSASDSKPTEGMKLLMTAMADYLEEAEDVQKAAKAEYQEARKLFVTVWTDSDSARTLAKSLTDAVNNYKAILGGQTYEIRFAVKNPEYSDSKLTITATNTYGKQWTDDNYDRKLQLPYGSYTFRVSYNGYSVSGDIAVSEAKVIDVSLPQEQWLILDSFRLSGSYGAETGTDSKFSDGRFTLGTWKDRCTTVPVPDTFSGTVYTYAQYDTTLLKSPPTMTAVYTMKNAASTDMEKTIPFESLTSGAEAVLAMGAEGNTVIYRVSSAGTDGYTYSQDYTVTFVRIPTLSSITVVGTGNDGKDIPLAPMEDFAGSRNAYTYKILNTVGQLTIRANPFLEDKNYSITVKGADAQYNVKDGVPVTIPTDQDSVIELVVSASGQTNTYSLAIQPGKGQLQIFSSMKDVTLQVFNRNGVEIPYTAHKATDNSNRYQFNLVPGESYSYTATYNTYYHITDQFTPRLNSGAIIEVDFRDVSDWLVDLAFGEAEDGVYKNSIAMTDAFRTEKHHYQAELVDTENLTFVWAKAADMDMTIEAIYCQNFSSSLYHGKNRTVQLDSGKTAGTQLQRLLMDENPVENSVTIRLTKHINGVTHFQDYIVDFRRILTLKKLTAECDGAATVLQQTAEKTGFDPGIKNYSVKVSLAAKNLVLDLAAPQGSLCHGEKELGYRITVKEKNKETVLKEASRAVIELDGTIDTQTVTVTVENEKAPEGTAVYTVKILKAPPVQVTFDYHPQSALLNLREVLSGERLWPDENGAFRLCEGYSYDYVLSEYGYVSKAGCLEVTQNDEDQLVILDDEREYQVEASGDGGAANIVWSLTAAPENGSIDKSIESFWPDFRGNHENNAVKNVKIPALAAEGTLYWAQKIGSGTDSDAVGSPILVDGDIITYASDKIYRIDTMTGEKKVTGAMDHKSSFSITPPTYAEGMVFVALSNGCVQAFNAETLESLWIYQDPLGGQPNCPITVDEDGYLYTGFWNSETGNANFVCLTITDEQPGATKERKEASWFYTAKGGFYWAGAYVGSDFVLVGTDDGTNTSNSNSSRLLLLDKKTGRLLDSWDGLNGDIRSSIVYENGTYYFTSKGGSFYSVQVSGDRKLTNGWRLPLDNGVGGIPMSTSTPVVYNGRAYVGVSGAGQFSSHSGHNISVIDLNSRSVAYRVPTQGYPQTSGLLTTAYEGYAYVYFFDNMTPGKLRVLRDKPGMTAPDIHTEENGNKVAYALFTPTGNHAQYAICSPIVDEYGTVYFKNDSGHLMAFGSTVTGLNVDLKNARTEYLAGESFDPSGVTVTADYANGKSRDVTEYVTFSTAPLSVENPLVTISYAYGLYQNQENSQEMISGKTTPTVSKTMELSVTAGRLGDVDCNGMIDQADANLILDYEAQLLDKTLNPMVADVSGDSVIDSNDAVLILQYPEIIAKFPAEESQPTE